jgi:hypothetical protein
MPLARKRPGIRQLARVDFRGNRGGFDRDQRQLYAVQTFACAELQSERCRRYDIGLRSRSGELQGGNGRVKEIQIVTPPMQYSTTQASKIRLSHAVSNKNSGIV